MHTIPVMLAHGFRGTGAVGLILVAGIVILFAALVFAERSGSPSKKD